MRGPQDKHDKQRRFKESYHARGTTPLNTESVRRGRSIFWKNRVIQPEDSPRLLVSGENNVKLGKRVTKGKWGGFPIYQLTLEERATCDRSCHMWHTCYGNSMSRARRHANTDLLLDYLEMELEALQSHHPSGFVVRLHTLGDFYSMEYVKAWAEWLDLFPALHVFGYTQRTSANEVGLAVHTLANKRWDRFAVRWSVDARTAIEALDSRLATVRKPDTKPETGQFPCPAQLDSDICCANCGACWASDKTVSFIEHGYQRPPGRRTWVQEDNTTPSSNSQMEHGL